MATPIAIPRVLRATFSTLAFFFVLSCPAQQTLYTQSLETILTRANPHLELLVLDANTQQILANTFPNPATPIPVGSLLKSFLALAYLTHQPHPELNVICHGHPDRCWRAGGHGRLTLPEALAQSCNAYFLALARTLPLDEITLPTSPPISATPEDLIGLTAAWPISPETLATAYAQLVTSPSTPSPILDGMSLAATHGTASAIGQHPGGVLAKTGTAPCIPTPQRCLAANDGLVVAAVPAEHPTLILLVRRRAATGAITAQSAGRILTQLEALHAY
jgi:cell division protein FtsI/penicillin-binding protein 2